MFKSSFFIKQLFILCFGVLSVSAQMTFVHPGAVSSKEELDFVKAKVAAQAQPWYGAFTSMLAIATAPAATVPGDENGQRDFARNAYANALAWYLTDNVVYGNRAIANLKVWTTTFAGYVPAAGGNQAMLDAAWIGSLLGPAAELMRGYAGWNATDLAATQEMFRTKICPAIDMMSTWNGNVDLTQIQAMLSIAAFRENEVEFNAGISRLRLRNPAYFYLASDPAASRNYGGSTYNGSWFGAYGIDGVTQETCRDMDHHAPYALSAALSAAEVAWHQGVDVWTENTVRYTTAMELMAKQILTGSMQGTCATGNVTVNEQRLATYEMGYNHYHFRKGIDLPYTRQLLQTVIRTSPGPGSMWNVFYETLTHADVDSGAAQTPLCAKPNLGIDQSICGRTSIVLNSAITTVTNKTFAWYKDNLLLTGQIGTTLTATQAGTYRFEADSAGCKTSDVIVINGTLAVNLGVDKELCNPAQYTLDAGAANGTAATFLWNNGAKTQTISVSKAGTYTVTVSAASCTSVSDAITITSKLLNTVSDTICSAGTASLTTTEGGSYNWYDVATGGTALSTGISYSPNITATKTYYVEDPGGMSGSVGKTVVGAGTIWGGNTAADFSDAGKINKINVLKALTINSVAVYVTAGTSVTINLKQGATTVHTKTVTVTGTGKQTINLGFVVAPGEYVIDAVGTTATLGFEATGGAPAFPYIFTDYLSYTYNVAWSATNGWYGYFYDITFTAGNACARTPVAAVVDPNNSKCNTSGIISQTIDLQVGWNLISTNVIATDNKVETLFALLNVQQIKNDEAYWRAGQSTQLNSLKTITAGEGYLVYMNVAGTLTIVGTAMPTATYLFPTTAGWHIIGCPYQSNTALSTQFNATNTALVKDFEGFWEPNGGAINGFDSFESGKGYYLKVK